MKEAEDAAAEYQRLMEEAEAAKIAAENQKQAMIEEEIAETEA